MKISFQRFLNFLKPEKRYIEVEHMIFMLSFLYQIIRRLVTYLLPFVLLYVLTRRVEKRVPLRFSRYFLLSALLLVLGGIIHWIVYYPTPAYTHMLYLAGVITTISVLIMLFFVMKASAEFGRSSTQRGIQEILIIALFLTLGFCLVYSQKNALNIDAILYFSSMGMWFLVNMLTMHLYDDIGLIYKKLGESLWVLTFTGAILHMALFATNIAEAVGVAASGMIERSTDYMVLQISFGEPMALLGGVVSTLPGVLFYTRIRGSSLHTEALPDELDKLFDAVCDIVGYENAEMMLKKGIQGYNLQFSRDLEITKELFLKNMRTNEEKTLLNFLAGVFSKQVGPVIYRIYKELGKN
jgi:hypothetical protein